MKVALKYIDLHSTVLLETLVSTMVLNLRTRPIRVAGWTGTNWVYLDGLPAYWSTLRREGRCKRSIGGGEKWKRKRRQRRSIGDGKMWAT